MYERFTSCLGTLVLMALILAGVIWLGVTYEEFGFIDVPAPVVTAIARWEPTAGPILLETLPMDISTWTNPLEDLSSLTEAQIIQPTLPPPTPVPLVPVDAGVYRTETLLRMRALVADLEHWLALNQQLGANMTLLDDGSWQAEMRATLDRLWGSAQALGDVTPAPAEYTGIQSLLEQIRADTHALVEEYSLAMQTRGAEDFRAAGERFERIKSYLAQAALAMHDAGWVLQ